MQDNRDDLYLNLRDAGIGENLIGTQQEFKDFISNEQNARDFYKNLRDEGVGEDLIGTEDEFYNFIAPDFANNKDEQPTRTSSQPLQPFTQAEYDNLSPIAKEVAQGVGVAPGQQPARQQAQQPVIQQQQSQPQSQAPKTQFVPEYANVRGFTLKADDPLRQKYPFLNQLGENDQAYFRTDTNEPLYSWVDSEGKDITPEDAALLNSRADIEQNDAIRPKQVPVTSLELPENNTKGIRIDGSITDVVDSQMKDMYGADYINKTFKTNDGRNVNGAELFKERAQELYNNLNDDIRSARIDMLLSDDEEQKNNIINNLRQKYDGIISEDNLKNTLNDTEIARQDLVSMAGDEIAKARADEQRIMAEMDKRGAELDKRTSPFADQTFNVRGVDSEYRFLTAELNAVQDRIRSWEAVRDSKDIGLLRGLANTAGNIRNWDLGLSDFNTGLALLTARGEKKQELVNLLGGAQKAASIEDKTTNNIYRWAKIAGQSLPFTATFIATGGGYGNLARAVGNNALRFAEKRAVGDLAKGVIKNMGVGLGEVASSYLLATTAQAPGTAGDIMMRKAGEIRKGKDGNYMLVNGNGWGEAVYKGTTAAAIENYTEMLGAHLNIGKDIVSFLPKIGMGRMSNWFLNVGKKNWYNTTREWMTRMGINGYAGEVLEEEIAIPLNAILVGDNPLLFGDGGLLDKGTQADIAGGMLVSIAGMNAGTLAAYGMRRGAYELMAVNDERRLNNADEKALDVLGDKWSAIKEDIDNTPNETMPALIMKYADDESISKEGKEALAGYLSSLLRTRGHNLGQNTVMQTEEGNKTVLDNNLSPEEQENVHDDGMIHTALLYPTSETGGQPQQVFITRGNILTDATGKIDVEKSSDMITYRGADGQVHMASPDKFQSAATPISVEEYAAENTQPEAQEPVYSQGDEVILRDENGNAVRGEIMYDENEDGLYQVQTESPINGASINMFTGDELNNLRYNETAHQPATAPVSEDVAPQITEQPALTGSAAAEQPDVQTAEQPAEGTVAGQQTEQAQTEQAQPRTAKERIPKDDKGEPVYDQAPVEATIADLYDGQLDDEEVQGFINANIADAQKRYDNVQKKAPKIGTNKAKYLEQKRKWQADMDEAKRVLDYWNEVNNQKQTLTHTTESELQAAQAELSGQNAREEFNELNPDGMNDAVSVASDFIRGAKITPESFRNETGYGMQEQRRFVGMIANEQNGGKSINRLAEELVSYDNAELGGVTYNGDTSAAKNAILEALQSAGTRGELTPDNTAEQEKYVEARRAELDNQYMEAYGMTYEEYLAYEEQIMPDILRNYANFDEADFYNLYADEIDNTLNARINEQGNDTTGEEQRTDNSNEVLPGKRSDNTGGSAGGTEQGAEVQSGVQGSAENGAVQEEAQGVDERDGGGNQEISERLTEEADEIVADMEEHAEVAPEIELTIENWDALFGEDGLVNTPLGEVKMGENQFTKMMRKGRNSKLGMVKPTLENPDIIVEDRREAKDGGIAERGSSYVFVKAFIKNDGTRYYYFTSITVSKEGKEVVVSNQEKSRNRVLRLILEGNVIWRTPKDATTSSAEKQGLDYAHPYEAEDATKGSGITPQSISSESKDSENSQNSNESGEKIAKAEEETDTNPTEAQKEAGNYKKGHVRIDGFDVTIESPKGSVRSGVDAGGNRWETTMQNTYGYIRGTEGVDGDHIDVFLSDNPETGNVYVVDQVNPENGEFDEHKVMYGFNSAEGAREAYLSNYSEGWQGLGNITEVSKDDFKKWINSSKRKTKPFAEYKSVNKANNTSGKNKLTAEAHNVFDGIISASSHNVEINGDEVSETDNTLYAPISVDGKKTNLSLYQTEPVHSSEEPVVGVSYYREGLTYQEASDLADAYNEYRGERVCSDGTDELAVNFGSIDEAVKFEEWNNENIEKNAENGNKEVSLQQDNEADEVSQQIPQREYGALPEGDRTLAEVSDGVARGSRLYEEEHGGRRADVAGLFAEQRAAERLAKENGYWLPIDDVMDLGVPGPSGNENDTYISDGIIYKVNNLLNSGGIVKLFDKILLHNRLFPNTRYNFTGFAGYDGRSVYPIFSQRMVEDARPARVSEIDTYMQNLGFKETGDGRYTKGNYEVWDIVPKNVLVSPGGNVYVIDAEGRINDNTANKNNMPQPEPGETATDYARRLGEWNEGDKPTEKTGKGKKSKTKLKAAKTAMPLTESEYAEKRMKEIIRENKDIDEDDAENIALDEYHSYIAEKIKSGELEQLYADASINDRIKLSKIVDAAGFEVSDISGLANEERKEERRRNNHKVGERLSIEFNDGTVVTGTVIKAEDGKITVQSEDNDRKYTVSENKIVPIGSQSAADDVRFREADDEVRDFAEKHNLNVEDVASYADSMKRDNLNGAARAFHEIRRKLHIDNIGVSLGQFAKIFTPVEKELYSKFGNIDNLRQKYVQAEMEQRNVMEAARKRAEEEAEAERRRLQVFQDMTDKQLDDEYMKAVEANDESRMRDLVNEAARRNGYGDVSSEYQGVGAWAAPSNPGYESDEERRKSLETDGNDVNVEDIAAGYSAQPDDYFTNLRGYGNDTPHGHESAEAINKALDEIKAGKKPKIKVYRAVPKSVKEGKLRNGDWVTPSKKYAQMHGDNRLEGDYRIIEQEVPADELWWDGNDINEWGYDDGKSYAYRNTRNNRKLNDLITRDDEGNVIPLSERFNARKSDVRYRFIGEQGAARLDAAEEVTTRLDNLAVAKDMEAAFNEKKKRIEKLRDSKPVEITGNEIEPNDDLKQYKKNALEYGKKLQGSFTNRDTGQTIQLQRGRRNGGINEVLQHDYKDVEHLQSIAAIPQIIENSIYIDSRKNTDSEKNPDVVEYQYYVCGLNIGGKDYTVRSTVAVDKRGNRYYDHKLTSIEKGKLLDLFNEQAAKNDGFGTTPGTKPTTVKSYGKDSVLISILQTNEQENARKIKLATGWERGADGKWKYETPDVETAVNDMATDLGVNVRVAHSADEVTNAGARAAIESGRNIKGWFDTNTGEIVVYLPNARNAEDAVRTVLHEGVAHYGLRQLVGEENFNTSLDNIYNNVSEDVKNRIDAMSQQHGWSTRVATEEYLASLAEDGNFEEAKKNGVWQKIKDFFIDLLTKAGVRLDNALTDNELRYILWRSYDNLQNPVRGIAETARDITKQHELNVGNYARELASDEDIEDVNRRFNEELEGLTEENADKTTFSLGRPSDLLRAAGVADKPMKLYGNKIIKKMKKHGFTLDELRDLPRAVANPIAVFNNYQKDGNRSILTEMTIGNKNVLVSLTIGKGNDVDFNIVSSVFGKGENNIIDWINKGYATYINKRKALDYLHFSESSISEASGNQELISAANIVRNFENPKTEGENLRYREDDEAGDGSSPTSASIINAWDNLANSDKFKLTETAFDYLNAVDKFQKLVAKASGKVVKSFENAYDALTFLSSKNKEEMDMFDSFIVKPLNKALLKVAGVEGGKSGEELDWGNGPLREIVKYVEAKHGTERNRQMAVETVAKADKQNSEAIMRDWTATKKDINSRKDLTWREKQLLLDDEAAKLGADLSEDYSGLSSVFGDKKAHPDGWQPASRDFVEAYENTHPKEDIDELWRTIGVATSFTLHKQYETGLVSREYVERQQERFEYYIPLRGFEDEVAGDVYNYMEHDFYPGSNPVRKAKGRKSEPGNPFGSMLNTAYASISSGNKNVAKTAFYSLVKNHDTGGLAVAQRAWAVRYDKLKEIKELEDAVVMPEIDGDSETPEWVEAVPRIPGNVSAEERSRMLSEFENLMKKYQKENVAKPIGKKAKIAYKTLYKQRNEHEIQMFIAGDKYIVTITGNPRVAQAVNGLLNPDTGKDDWLTDRAKRIRRFMAGAFTAQNLAFSIANLTKDTMYANNQAFIRENPGYWIRFTKNQRLGFGDFPLMMSRLKRYRDNKLDMNDSSDRLFKEFMENGGATGYTFVDTQEEYAKELAKKLNELGRGKSKISAKKVWKTFFDAVEFTGQSAELVNRFAAYKTSREMGRPVNRAIRDAKEITVNFNRKGAGGKTKSENNKWYINMAASISQYGMTNIIFWNANMQSKYMFFKNMKDHPIKTSTTTIASNLLLGSAMIPFMNNLVLPALYAMFGLDGGGDDDDNDNYYNALTDWERTHNICVRLPGRWWLKLPLSPEMVPWFTMGDALGGAISGQRELTAKDFIHSSIDAVSPLSINWEYEGAQALINVVPSAFQPLTQTAANVNFMGSPIKKTPLSRKQSYTPEYKMVYSNASPTLVELSRLNNRMFGGEDDKANDKWDFNPATVQTLISGYTGGYGTTLLALSDYIVSTAKGDSPGVTVSKIPIVSRFAISGNKDVRQKRINSSYYDVKKFVDEFEFDMDRYAKRAEDAQVANDPIKLANSMTEYNRLLESERAKKYIDLAGLNDSIKKYEDYLKEMPDDEASRAIMYDLKQKALEILKRKREGKEQ